MERLDLRMAVLLLAVLAVLPACSSAPGDAALPEPPPVAVQTVTLAAAAMARSIPAVGTLTSPHSTDVAPEVAGTVVELDVPEGREVEAGHVLARLDDARARASLSVTDARSRNASAALQRWRALHQAQIAAPQALDDAVAEKQATAGQVEEARTALDKTAVRAPFRGVTGLRQVSLGAYLQPGTPVVRLTQIDPLELRFAIPQRHLAAVAVGQTVRGVVGSCDTPLRGTVSAIEPDVDPATRMVRLQAIVPNADGRLRPGMAARLRLEIGTVADALLAPLEAVVREGTRTFVWVVAADGTATPSDVHLGDVLVDRVQLRAGVAAGDVVVTAGHQKLRPGARVASTPHTPITNPKLAVGAGDDPACEF
jgi:membrane fusion protein (multidrug efflux system)